MRISAISRQHIVALTQTEIMFVLAAIILILLQFKQRELEAALDDKQQEEPAQLAAAGEDRQSRESGQLDLDKEVKEILDRAAESGNERGGGEEASSVDGRIADDVEPIGELDPGAGMKEILGRAQASGAIGADGSQNERIHELIRLAAVGREVEAVAGEPSLHADSSLPGSNPAPTAEPDLEDGPHGSKVGFDPCWERVSPAGDISYYTTFETKYDVQKDAYMISPAWDETVPLVRSALEGPLALLNRHPEGWIAPERYAEYIVGVRDLAEALYSPGCRLVTTIDEPTRRSIKQIAPYLYPIVK